MKELKSKTIVEIIRGISYEGGDGYGGVTDAFAVKTDDGLYSVFACYND